MATEERHSNPLWAWHKSSVGGRRWVLWNSGKTQKLCFLTLFLICKIPLVMILSFLEELWELVSNYHLKETQSSTSGVCESSECREWTSYWHSMKSTSWPEPSEWIWKRSTEHASRGMPFFFQIRWRHWMYRETEIEHIFAGYGSCSAHLPFCTKAAV